MQTVLLPDRTLITVSGNDAEHLLQNVITCDLDSLTDGSARPGALLTPQGKILFDFLIARSTSGGLTIDISADQAAAFIKRMMLYKLRSDMTLSAQNDMQVAVAFGENVSYPDSAVRDERFKAATVYRWAAERSDAQENDRHQWDLLRIQHGIAEGGLDYPLGEAFPHDVSLDQNGGVDFKKGCYVGQEVVSRMQHRGTARRRIMIAKSAQGFDTATNEVLANGKSVANLGTKVGDRALLLGRIDRVDDAIKECTPLMVGDVAIDDVQLPPSVGYVWPVEAQSPDG
ncbi:MAG: folate-binding protein [Pseudomonadota bacterium]